MKKQVKKKHTKLDFKLFGDPNQRYLYGMPVQLNLYPAYEKILKEKGRKGADEFYNALTVEAQLTLRQEIVAAEIIRSGQKEVAKQIASVYSQGEATEQWKIFFGSIGDLFGGLFK